MYMSKLIGKTMKKIDDEYYLPSQELLLRTGMFRNIEPGRFTALPLGVKAINKIIEFLTQKLEGLGFQRVYVTSEEEFVKKLSLSIRNDIKSYKELPALLYDILTIYRQKTRVRDGLLGAKEYMELRGCSFHQNDESLMELYDKFKDFYKNLFSEMGLQVLDLLAYNPKSGYQASYSFVVKAAYGDKVIFECNNCDYMALEEVADFYIDEISDMKYREIEDVYTPNIKTISELEKFLGIKAEELAKTLLVKAKDEVLAVVLRGDRELNLYKLSMVLNVPIENIKMADKEDIKDLGTVTGFVGPVGLKNVRIIVDTEITKRGLFITGANKKDYHIKNVKVGRDFNADVIADISYIKEDDRCPLCGGDLGKEYGISVAGFYGLDKMTEIKNFNYKDREGKTKEIVGIYHYIDIYRLLSTVVEKYHDENGIIWPIKIAPYHVIVSVLNAKKEEKKELGKKIYDELKNAKFDVIIDDRNERAGAKFKDADILGIPIRIVVGKRAEEKIVEYKLRWEEEKEELKIYEALGKALKLMKSEGVI